MLLALNKKVFCLSYKMTTTAKLEIGRWRNYDTNVTRRSEAKFFDLGFLETGTYEFKIDSGRIVLSSGSVREITGDVNVILVKTEDRMPIKQLYTKSFKEIIPGIGERRTINLDTGYTSVFVIEKGGNYSIMMIDRTSTSVAGANCAGPLDCAADIEAYLDFTIRKI